VKKVLFISLALVLVLSLALVGCGGGGGGTTGSTKIVIGMSRSLTGVFGVIHSSAFGAIYPTYINMTNTAGGIPIGNTTFQVEAKVLNDNSEAGKLQTHITALTNDVEDGEVHTIFGPTCTYFIDLAAPICNDAGVVLMTAEGGATFLEGPGYLPEWPYVFITLSFSDWYQLPVLAPLLKGAGANTAYIFWQNDAHGLEYLATAAIEFPAAGITIVGNASVLATDSSFVPPTLLAAANATNPDVVCCFCYPGEIMGLTGTAIGLGYQFDAWCTGPGANFGWFKDAFGPGSEAGVICFAVANNKTSPAMANLFNNVLTGGVVAGQDFWGHPLYWAAMQIWQAAVTAVGAQADDGNFIIDQTALKNKLASYNSAGTGVTTVLGPTYYTMFGTGGGILAYQCHTGEIGQWQSGYVEIIGGNNVTSSIVYPKANW
jgi:ABC-type branched-subunit amino acid transport system substrate-binding protein